MCLLFSKCLRSWYAIYFIGYLAFDTHPDHIKNVDQDGSTRKRLFPFFFFRCLTSELMGFQIALDSPWCRTTWSPIFVNCLVQCYHGPIGCVCCKGSQWVDSQTYPSISALLQPSSLWSDTPSIPCEYDVYWESALWTEWFVVDRGSHNCSQSQCVFYYPNMRKLDRIFFCIGHIWCSQYPKRFSWLYNHFPSMNPNSCWHPPPFYHWFVWFS